MQRVEDQEGKEQELDPVDDSSVAKLTRFGSLGRRQSKHIQQEQGLAYKGQEDGPFVLQTVVLRDRSQDLAALAQMRC